MSRQGQGLAVLIVSTLAFTVCFMVWMMFGVIGIPIKTTLGLNATEFGLLTATPVLTGSLIRVPLGMWTDKYGGRIVLFVLMMLCVVPIFLISYATEYWHFLVLGLFVGMAGGSFSVGTPYVARWFSKERQGFAMGVYGAGNSGAAVNKFVAPALIVAFGWTAVPQVYSGAMLATALIFWLFSHSDPTHLVDSKITWRQQLVALKDPKVWKLCQYYSIVFGGYVAMSLWMDQYYVGEFGLTITNAALLAACFSLPGGVLRAVGDVRGVQRHRYRGVAEQHPPGGAQALPNLGPGVVVEVALVEHVEVVAVEVVVHGLLRGRHGGHPLRRSRVALVFSFKASCASFHLARCSLVGSSIR